MLLMDSMKAANYIGKSIRNSIIITVNTFYRRLAMNTLFTRMLVLATFFSVITIDASESSIAQPTNPIQLQLIAQVPEEDRSNTRFCSYTENCFLMLIPTETIINPGNTKRKKVKGYYVTAYAKQHGQLRLPSFESCKTIFNCQEIYLAPTVAEIHDISNKNSRFFPDKIKKV
jgi:hypothetical protein